MLWQRGLGELPLNVSHSSDDYVAFLESAIRLSSQGIDPYRYIDFLPKALWNFTSKLPLQQVISEFEKFTFELQERGLGFAYPLAVGLKSMAQS